MPRAPTATFVRVVESNGVTITAGEYAAEQYPNGGRFSQAATIKSAVEPRTRLRNVCVGVTTLNTRRTWGGVTRLSAELS